MGNISSPFVRYFLLKPSSITNCQLQCQLCWVYANRTSFSILESQSHHDLSSFPSRVNMPIVLAGDVRVYREMNKNFMYNTEGMCGKSQEQSWPI